MGASVPPRGGKGPGGKTGGGGPGPLPLGGASLVIEASENLRGTVQFAGADQGYYVEVPRTEASAVAVSIWRDTGVASAKAAKAERIIKEELKRRNWKEADLQTKPKGVQPSWRWRCCCRRRQR
jgi:hypothetical protein